MYEPKLKRSSLPVGIRPENFRRQVEDLRCLPFVRSSDPTLQRLRDKMGTITDAVLASTLKELIADGIVKRQSFTRSRPAWSIPLRRKACPLFLSSTASVIGLPRIILSSPFCSVRSAPTSR